MIHFIIIRYLKWMREPCLRFLFVSTDKGMIFWVTSSHVTLLTSTWRLARQTLLSQADSSSFISVSLLLCLFLLCWLMNLNSVFRCWELGLGGLDLIITKVANIYISTVVYWQVCLFLWKYITEFVWYRHQKICFISKWVYLHQLLRK